MIKIQEQDRCGMYNAGNSIGRIARHCGVCSHSIRDYLLRRGVKMRSHTPACRLTTNEVEDLVSKFDSGVSIRKLATIYKYTPSGVSFILSRHGRFGESPKTEADWSFIYDVNDLFLYWLGWMLSDGCIHHVHKGGRNRGISAGLTVKRADSHILEFFKSFIHQRIKINCQKNAATLAIALPREHTDYLSSYGLVQRKSLILAPTELLNSLTRKEFMQMLGGYIEGDGTVNIKCLKSRSHRYKCLSVGITCGSRRWLEWINYKLMLFGYKSRKIYVKVSKKYPRSTGFDYRVVGAEAVRLADELMQNKYALLNRKWDNARQYAGLTLSDRRQLAQA